MVADLEKTTTFQTLVEAVVIDHETVTVPRRKERAKEERAGNEENTMKTIVTVIEVNHHKNARRSNRSNRSKSCQLSNVSRSSRRPPFPLQNLMEILMVVVVAAVGVVVVAVVGVVVAAVVAQVAGVAVVAEAEVVAALEVTQGNLEERNASCQMMKIITLKSLSLDRALDHGHDRSLDLVLDRVLDHVQGPGLNLALVRSQGLGLDLVNQDRAHQAAADLVPGLSRAQKVVLVHVQGLHLNQAIKFVMFLVCRVYL